MVLSKHIQNQRYNMRVKKNSIFRKNYIYINKMNCKITSYRTCNKENERNRQTKQVEKTNIY